MAAYTTIDDPEAYFQVKIWTGTGSSNALTLDGDTDMAPDYVMIKQRSSTQQWNGYDAPRGVTKYLGWNTGIVENTQAEGLTAFGSDGFTVGTDDLVNKSSSTYVAFCWKESATSGFDMVLYAGTGSARDISHSLSAVPKMIFVKDRDTDGYAWHVYNEKVGNGKTFYLNVTNAPDTNSSYWNDTTPTSSVFSVGTSVTTNNDGDDFIAYLFADVQGFCKLGSWVGTGNLDGAFVYTGFRPAFVMQKGTNDNAWNIWDNKRSTFNEVQTYLQPTQNYAEVTSTSGNNLDFCANGFKITEDNGEVGTSGQEYIYLAIAEAPFVNSNGVPCNAR